MEEYRLEVENRIRNLVWTVSGDYTMEVRPDVEGFQRARNTAIYDCIKQGAFAKYLDREQLSLYLVKKMFLQAQEAPLLVISSLCIEEAVRGRLMAEREGIAEIRRKACEEILNQDFGILTSSKLGMFKAAYLRESLEGEITVTRQNRKCLELLYSLRDTEDTGEVIKVADRLYNQLVEPDFEKKKGSLEKVLSITLQELAEYSWKDFLSEEMYEDNLEVYLERISENMTTLDIREDNGEQKESEEEKEEKKRFWWWMRRHLRR